MQQQFAGFVFSEDVNEQNIAIFKNGVDFGGYFALLFHFSPDLNLQ